MLRRRIAPTITLALCAAFCTSEVAWALPYCQVANTAAPSALVRAAQWKLGPVPAAEIGPVAETLASELHREVCSAPRVAALLPNTCAPFPTGSVEELRTRLLADLLTAPLLGTQSRLDSLAPEQQLGVTFLASLTGSLAPAEVAHRAAVHLGAARSPECEAPSVQHSPAQRAITLVWHLTTPAAAQQSEQELLVLLSGLVQPGPTPAPLDPARTVWARRLIAQSRAALGWWRVVQQEPTNTDAMTQLLLSELTMFQEALALAQAHDVELPTSVWAILDAVKRGEAEAASTLLRQWRFAGDQVPGEVMDLVDLVLRFLRARSRQEAERIVRGRLLGLGPWSEKVLFSASGGVPTLSSDAFNVVGEGLLGYSDSRWGTSVAASASIFDSTGEVNRTTEKFTGNVDGWLSWPLGETTVFDVRGTFETVLFDEDFLVFGEEVVGSEENLLVRGGGLLGLRYQRPLYALGAWLGGGAQLQSYGSDVTDIQTGQFQQSDDDSVAGYGAARVRAQWAVAERVVSLRASLDWKFYSIARVTSNLDTGADPGEEFLETDFQATQIEAIGRGFVDVEALRFFDFVPGAGVGLDHYQLAVSGQDTEVTTIPIYMVGVRRAVF